jgi:hypothetical protein
METGCLTAHKNIVVLCDIGINTFTDNRVKEQQTACGAKHTHMHANIDIRAKKKKKEYRQGKTGRYA